MKKVILIITVLLTLSSFAQNHSCSYISTSKNYDLYNILNTIQNTDDDISQIVNLITDQCGVFPNFVLQRVEGFGNCAAITDKNGIRYILYDRDFLQYQSKISKTNYWAVVFIIAHEIGHHLNGHNRVMLNDLDKRNTELQADQFAGFIMKKLGATKDEIIKILDLTSFDLFSYTDTHPAKIDRINSANLGFDKAEFTTQNINNSSGEVVNSLVYRVNQITQNIELNTAKNQSANNQTVNPASIKGDAYLQTKKYSNPSNWFVSYCSNTFITKDGCFIYKFWKEDFTYDRAPQSVRENPMAAALITNNHGKIFTSYDVKGENAFVFNVYSTTKGVLRRNKKIFKVKVKLKNTSDNLFPENVWTNKERTKILFLADSNDELYPYKTIYIDLKGYEEIYKCMSEEQKKKYTNPERIIKLLLTIEN